MARASLGVLAGHSEGTGPPRAPNLRRPDPVEGEDSMRGVSVRHELAVTRWSAASECSALEGMERVGRCHDVGDSGGSPFHVSVGSYAITAADPRASGISSAGSRHPLTHGERQDMNTSRKKDDGTLEVIWP